MPTHGAAILVICPQITVPSAECVLFGIVSAFSKQLKKRKNKSAFTVIVKSNHDVRTFQRPDALLWRGVLGIEISPSWPIHEVLRTVKILHVSLSSKYISCFLSRFSRIGILGEG